MPSHGKKDFKPRRRGRERGTLGGIHGRVKTRTTAEQAGRISGAEAGEATA